MQDTAIRELERRAALSNEADIVKQLEAQSRVRHEIELMKEEGKALILTAEEESMLKSFRRFKLRMRKNGEVFKWQTTVPDGVQIVEDTAEVVHPNEVAE